MNFKEKLIESATHLTSNVDGKALPIVLLVEGQDQRVISAAKKITELKLARVKLLSKSTSNDLPSSVELIDPRSRILMEQFSEELSKSGRIKNSNRKEIEKLLEQEVYFGGMYLASGYSDMAISGAVTTTSDVIRSGIKTIGLSKDSNLVSSSFLMILADGRCLTYGDCGVVPYPTSEQLAEIGISSAKTHELLTGEQAKVALLSFSTKGSSKHERVDLVCNALKLIKQKMPTLQVDGELQFDAAYLPSVAKIKAAESLVAGKANVFIFPNLDAGNIAYKITERIGGATAIGPILQGLNKPWMDLSRGCSSDDIVLMSAVASHLR